MGNVDLAKYSDLTARDLTNNKYPSPYLNIAETKLPKTIKGILDLCRKTFYWSPVIRPVIKKIAEYPATPFAIKTKKELKGKWEKILKDILDLNRQHKRIGYTYYAFGNSFSSVVFPLRKELVCPKCAHKVPLKMCEYEFKRWEFYSTCMKCKHKGKFETEDVEIKEDYNGLSIKHWPPERIDIKNNELTGRNIYYYTMSPEFKARIVKGDKDILPDIPKSWMEAIKNKNPVIRMNPKNFIHLHQSEIVDDFSAWGIPLPISVLALDFYLKLLRRAQEAICFERIFSLRYLYPAQDVTGDAFRNIDLGEFKTKILNELKEWKKDPNRISVFPIPLGQGNFGGDAKLLMVTGEIKDAASNICIGMGIPPELLMGGFSYSGSQVSMRMFENFLEAYREDLVLFDKRLISILTSYYPDLGVAKDTVVEMKDFKMADDAIRTEVMQNLNAAKKISDETMANRFNIDLESERGLIEENINWQAKIKEQMAIKDVEIMGKVEKKKKEIMSKLEGEMETSMGSAVSHWRNELSNMSGDERQSTLEQIEKENPELHKSLTGQPLDGQEEMETEEPLPEQLPPRRKKAVV